MYVRPRYRGLGFGKLLLNHLEEYVRQQGIGLVRLETGIHQTAAIQLYERTGYERIGPFGPYKDDPLSVFYEKCVTRHLRGTGPRRRSPGVRVSGPLRRRDGGGPDEAGADRRR